MLALEELNVKLFADGADVQSIAEHAANLLIKGFTTNPTLMKKAGVEDYRAFAIELLEIVKDRPISFEVFADELPEMEEQALEISSWGENVFVKIPVTNCRQEPCDALYRRLAQAGVKVNATALMTLDQVGRVAEALAEAPAGFISLFAGRIADTGRDPVPMMAEAVRLLETTPRLQLIWASPRELLNVFQADSVGCHVITATLDILKKLPLVGRDLTDFSLETVRMFHDDARAAGYSLVSDPRLAVRG